MAGITKAEAEQRLALASTILAEQGGVAWLDSLDADALRDALGALNRLMAVRGEMSRGRAARWIAKAARRERGEIVEARGWGGAREGAGRKAAD